MPALATRFPLNDGGMFYDMTRELQANDYRLPAATSYNGLDLPYAYPPLGFYLTALLSDIVRIPLLDLFLWLPAVFATLAIPAFYLFARALLADDLRAALATLFFALTPGSYFWHLMGGGVTRATGMLFLLIGATFVYRLFQYSNIHVAPVDRKNRCWQDKSCGAVISAILFSSLAVLSHPEVGLQAAGLCAIFWLFYGRTKQGVFHAFLVASGVLIFTAPWWGTVIAQHGLSPFLSAIQTGQHSSVNWLDLLASIFLSSEFIPLLLLLRLFGIVYAIWKRQYLLLALVFVPAILDPRSASSISFLAMNMLSAIGLLDGVPAMIHKLRRVDIGSILDHRAGIISVFVLSSLLFLQCGLRNYTLINTTLTEDEREAMSWVNANVSPAQNFYLITGRTYSMSDPVQEWFPTLTGQHSQTTLQGLEWTLGPQFTNRLDELVALQACESVACVEAWSARTGLVYEYLWVNKTLNDLFEGLHSSGKYRLVYESETAALFSVK